VAIASPAGAEAMAGKSGTRGRGGAGAKRRGSPQGLGHDATDDPGRSSSSPGHRKKAAGVQSAREFARGRVVEIAEPERDARPGEGDLTH
jgi:hypothetical protein